MASVVGIDSIISEIPRLFASKSEGSAIPPSWKQFQEVVLE
jgi:hypothetical protein